MVRIDFWGGGGVGWGSSAKVDGKVWHNFCKKNGVMTTHINYVSRGRLGGNVFLRRNSILP